MIKIPVRDELLSPAQEAHANAVTAYIKKKKERDQKELFDRIQAVMQTEEDFDILKKKDDWHWVSDFILADIDTMRRWIKAPRLLQFEEFKKLYKNRFSNGNGSYVDSATKYNAYSFVRNIGLTVCPYCDEEYLDIIEKEDGGNLRTLEIDHFFPQGQFPALAMCFYNLVPSGQNCNGIKLETPLGMSPFEETIEQCSWLYPDLPVGVNMENVSARDCTIHFHPKAGMKENVRVLHLEKRYERHKEKAHKYLLLAQQFDDDKIDEMIRQGFFPSRNFARRVLFEEPLEDNGERQLLTKMKKDLMGRKG